MGNTQPSSSSNSNSSHSNSASPIFTTRKRSVSNLPALHSTHANALTSNTTLTQHSTSSSSYSTFGHATTARTRSISSASPSSTASSSTSICVKHLVRQLLPHDTLASLALLYRSDKAQLKHCNRLYDDTIAHLRYLLIPASSSISVSERNIRLTFPLRESSRDREPFVQVDADALVLVGFNNSPFEDATAERLDVRVPYADIESVVEHEHGSEPSGIVCVAPYKNVYYLSSHDEESSQSQSQQVEQVEEEREEQPKNKKRRCKEGVLLRIKACKVPILLWVVDATRLVQRVARHTHAAN